MRDPTYLPISTSVSVSVPTAPSSAAASPGSGPCAMLSPSSGLGRSAHGRRGALDRLDDVVVAGTAAQVALEPEADLLLAGRLAVLDQSDGRHDHSRGAVTTLQRMVLPEGLLHGMQLTIAGQALDRDDLAAVGLDGQHGARLHRLAVHHHRAGTARRGVATDVRAGQPQRLPQEVDEELARLDVGLPPDPVHRASDVPQRATSLASGAIAPGSKGLRGTAGRTGFAPLHPIPLADRGFRLLSRVTPASRQRNRLS